MSFCSLVNIHHGAYSKQNASRYKKHSNYYIIVYKQECKFYVEKSCHNIEVSLFLYAKTTYFHQYLGLNEKFLLIKKAGFLLLFE